jgi:hypothetical protein
MNEILDFLKKNGETLDVDIARAAGLTLSITHQHLADLAARGKIVAYHSTRFVEGRKIEGIRCRLTGFRPKASPGRKPKSVECNT